MTTSFDTLATLGTELTTEQLDDIDGGMVLLIIAGLALVDGALWGYILEPLADGEWAAARPPVSK